MSNKTQTLALENRPKRWSEVLGQEIATKILTTSIARDEIKPGYLFKGTSGCGKTTTALLFAKRLTCSNPNLETQDPCNECRACLAIDKNIEGDVRYVDGAASRSVEFVRTQIYPFLQSAPIYGKRRILVIDEAHLYGKDAISAFLTLLEQMPTQWSRSVVILCTTDGDSLPVTIHNRCLSINFAPIPLDTLAESVAHYTGASVEVMKLVAEHSGGSFRTLWSHIESWNYLEQDLDEPLLMRIIGGVTVDERTRLWREITTSNLDAAGKRWRAWIQSGAQIGVIADQLAKDLLLRAESRPTDTSWRKAMSILSGARLLGSDHALLSALYLMGGLPLELADAKPEVRFANPSTIAREPIEDRLFLVGS